MYICACAYVLVFMHACVCAHLCVCVCASLCVCAIRSEQSVFLHPLCITISFFPLHHPLDKFSYNNKMSIVTYDTLTYISMLRSSKMTVHLQTK